jgi:ribose 5-phosphate isomerase B
MDKETFDEREQIGVIATHAGSPLKAFMMKKLKELGFDPVDCGVEFDPSFCKTHNIPLKIGVASDHAGFALKTHLIAKLQEWGYETVDYGTDSENSVDYPDFGHPLGEAMDEKECSGGIAICYSGNGIGMVMNRHTGVRAALCWNSEIAALARKHNAANVCVLPGHFVTENEAEEIVTAFLSTEFEGGRHIERVKKINSGLQL